MAESHSVQQASFLKLHTPCCRSCRHQNIFVAMLITSIPIATNALVAIQITSNPIATKACRILSRINREIKSHYIITYNTTTTPATHSVWIVVSERIALGTESDKLDSYGILMQAIQNWELLLAEI